MPGSLFPAQLDTVINIPTIQDNLTNLKSASINNLQSCIFAIEAYLGLGANATYNTVASRLNAIEGDISGIANVTFFGDITGSPTSQTVVGIRNYPVLNIAPTAGQAIIFNGSAYAPGDIVVTPPYIVILNTAYTLVEVGEAIGTLSGTVFFASYSSAPITGTIVDNKGNPPQNIFTAPSPSTPPNVFVYPQVYEYNTYPATPNSVSFTLTASNGFQTTVATTSITWTQRVYYGTAAPGGSSAIFIQSLQNNPLTTANAYSFTVNATADQSIYFACRSAYGIADIWVNGAEGGFNSGTTISVTNDFGFTENYTLYQSDQIGLGVTTVQIFFPSSTSLVDLDGMFSPGSGESESGQNIIVSSLKTTSYPIVTGDYLIAIGTLSAPITVTLPANPSVGNTYIVKDVNGSATLFNITVSGNGANIDGLSTYILTVNYESITIVFTATNQWSII